MSWNEWPYSVVDSHGRRRRGTVALVDDPAESAHLKGGVDFHIMMLTAPSRIRTTPVRTAVCVPAPTKVRSVLHAGARAPRSLARLRFAPHEMEAYAHGRIVTAAPGMLEPADIFPLDGESPRFDLLAHALVESGDAEDVAPYLALVRRELGIAQPADAVSALARRLSSLSGSGVPRRAPAMSRLRQAVRRLAAHRAPDVTPGDFAADLRFLALFDEEDAASAALDAGALSRLLADITARPARRRTRTPGRIVPFRPRTPGRER